MQMGYSGNFNQKKAPKLGLFKIYLNTKFYHPNT